MMFRILIIFLVLAVGCFIGPLIAGHQGVAFFQLAGYRVKMSFTSFMVLELLFLLALYVIYWLLKKLFYSKSAFSGWLRALFPNRSSQYIEQAQIFILEGEYLKASRLLAKGAKNATNKSLTYLQAAQASINHQQFIEARQQLELAAHTCTPNEKFAFKLVQLRLQIHMREFTVAKKVVEQLLQQKPRHQELLRLADQIYYELKDYQAIIDILPAMYKSEALSEAQLDQFKNTAYIGRINQLAEQSGDKLKSWWDDQPRAVRNNDLYQQAMVENLVKLGHHMEAEKLAKALAKRQNN